MIFCKTDGVLELVKIGILIFVLFVIQFSADAQEIYNPIQADLFSAVIDDGALISAPEWNSQFKDKFSIIRVKIFPHNSLYNAPHGRDVTTDSFSISSEGSCKLYKSDYDSSEYEISREHLIKTGSSFNFNASSFQYSLWVECSQSFALTRADYPQKPVSYTGLLFIKKVEASVPYLTAVNVLPFEQYLKGVVPSEMPAGWSVEVLKAQAIAARTYAYYELGVDVAAFDKNIQFEKSGAQIDDTVTYQAYLGLKNSAVSTDKAVDLTAGMVMTFENKVVKAYFHADSGGHTENAENVWGTYHPYIIGKPEIYPAGSIPGTNWGYTAKIKDIETKLIESGDLSVSDSLETLYIDSADLFPSTRPKFVVLKLANKVSKKIAAVRYAFVMGLKSQWLKFLPAADSKNIQVTGKGFGHGAGMNQWGARVMTEKMKKSYDQVLKFYYTNIDISK